MSEIDSETVALDGLERTTDEMTGATVMYEVIVVMHQQNEVIVYLLVSELFHCKHPHCSCRWWRLLVLGTMSKGLIM